MRKLFFFVLACSVLGFGQNVRYDAPFPSVSSSNPPFLIANLPPNSPTLQWCTSPANGVPCSNYSGTFDGLGNACPNGAQDTPQPATTSSCQPTGDSLGNIGVWSPAGTFDYTVCIGNSCFGPYTVTLGGSGGGSGTITGVLTASGSGLQGGGTSGTLNLSLINTCGPNQSLIWNGTAWLCGNVPAIWSALSSPVADLNLNLSSSGIAYISTFNCGDFTSRGGASNCVTFNGGGTGTTDKSYVFNIAVPATSYQNALNVSVDGFSQLQVCSLGGASHLGVVVVGNIITCPNLSISPEAKFTVMDNSPAHTGVRVFQNNVSASADMLQLNTAAAQSATAFNFVSWCANAVSGGDTTCSGPLGLIRGDGSVLAPNFLASVSSNTVVLNGVTLTGQPSGTGQCPLSTSTTAASWQTCGGGGGGTGSQFQPAVYTGTNVLGSVVNGLSGQAFIAQNGAYPLFASAGVPNNAISASTYTVACDSGTATVDRLKTVTFSANSTVTVPDPTDSGCGSNFTFALLAGNGVTLTVNRESAGTFNTFNGSSASTGLTTFSLSGGQYATLNAIDNTHYNVRVSVSPNASTPWSSIQNPSGNMGPLTMGTGTSTFQYASALSNAFLWQNTTTATSGTTNGSPVLAWEANYWTGSASATDTWSFSHSLASGTNGASTFNITQSGSSGAAFVSVPGLLVSNIIKTNSNANLLLQPNGTGAVVLNNGTATNPSLTFAAATQFGFYSISSSNIGIGTGSSAHDSHNFTTAGLARVISGGVFAFSSSATDASTAADTGVSRSAANVTAIGNGTAGNSSGVVKAAAFISGGTKFTSNGGCSETTLVGGATAGSFVLGANVCSVTVIMGNAATAPNGWSCSLWDFTTPSPTSASGAIEIFTTATTVTFNFGSVPQAADSIHFGCVGY